MIITSKLSQKTKAKLINLIYNTCLYPMRENEEEKPSDATFQKLRDEIEDTFFAHQSAMAQMQQQEKLIVISFATLFSAIAGILGRIYLIPFTPISNEQILAFNSIVGVILLNVLLILIMLILLGRTRGFSSGIGGKRRTR